MKRSSTPSRHSRPYSLRRTCGRDAMEMQSAASRQNLCYMTEETAGVAARHTSVGGECASPEHAHLTATLYPPGYVAPRLDLKKAVVEAALGEQPPPYVIFLSGAHFSPLLTLAQREAKLFPPRGLMNLVR